MPTVIDSIEVQTSDHAVPAILHRPADAGRNVPAVLVLADAVDPGGPAADLARDLTAALIETDACVMTWSPDPGIDESGETTLPPLDLTMYATHADDVAALFRHLGMLEATDVDRISVVGIGTGAIAAAALAAMTDRIARLALVAPIGPRELIGELTADPPTPEAIGLPRGRTIDLFDPTSLDIGPLLAAHPRPTLIVESATTYESSSSLATGLRADTREIEHTLVPRCDRFLSDEESRYCCINAVSRFVRP